MKAHTLAALGPPTQDQLRDAYRRMRRPSWPDGFEAALADPICGRLLHMGVRHPAATLRWEVDHGAAAPRSTPQLPLPFAE